MKTYFALIKNDIRLALRGRSVIFFNYLFPLMFFFAFAEFLGGNSQGGIAQVVSMVLVIGIMGNGLWGAGMRLVQEREMNILRRFRVTPISPLPILVASMVTGWLLYIPSLLLLLGLAHWLYRMPIPANLGSLVVLVTVGVWAFRSLGLIVASVVNGVQESTVLIQVLYMPMLFLSGATIPLTLLPTWAQIAGQFLPASYLISGIQGVFLKKETLAENLVPLGAMLLAMTIATFISTQLFRWEKEERIAPKARLYVLAVLTPFLLLGAYQAYSRENIARASEFWQEIRRTESFVIRNAKVWVDESRTIPDGGVLVRDGKIERLFEGAGVDPGRLEVIDGSGKTLAPGMAAIHAPGTAATSNAVKSGIVTLAMTPEQFQQVRSSREAGDRSPLPNIVLFRKVELDPKKPLTIDDLKASRIDLVVATGDPAEAAPIGSAGKIVVAMQVASVPEAEQALAAGVKALTYEGALDPSLAEWATSKGAALIPPAADAPNAMRFAPAAVMRGARQLGAGGAIRENAEANLALFDGNFGPVSRTIVRGERIRP